MNQKFTSTALFIYLLALNWAVGSEVNKSQLKTVQFSISDSVPPYNMLEENIPDHPGIQVEIVSDIMSNLGYQVKWKTMTNARASKELAANRLDGAINVSWNLNEPDKARFFESESIMSFKNCLIGKSDAQKSYPTLAAFNEMLKHKKGPRVMGFQGAAKVFASELPHLKNYRNYDEAPHQKLLVASLNAGRTDFVLSDYLVFKFYSKKILGNSDSFICLHQIPSGPRSLSFRDRSLRDRFNEELKKFISSGKKDEILNKYQLFLTKYLKESALLIKPHRLAGSP